MRIRNWESTLYAQINSFNAKKFAWGTHDCCTFAADCVMAITGIDKMKGYRGGYKSALTAARKLEKAGGLEKAITAELGEPISPRLAQRGDVVCFSSPLGDTAGICVGASIAAAGLDGVIYAPINQAFKAWRV